MLRNMLPPLATNNALDDGGVYPVVLGYLVSSHSAGSVAIADYRDIGLDKLRVRLIAALDGVSSDSPLGLHVLHVVGAGAWKEVGRIHARRIVAMVAHVKSIWNRAVSQLPRNVSSHTLPVVDGKLSIPIAVCGSRPEPALIITSAAVNVAPEPLGNGAAHPAGPAPSATEASALWATSVVRDDLKRLFAMFANNRFSVTIGTHFWSLLNRFRGAVPREIAVSPGLSHASIIAHSMGNLEVSQ